MVSIRRTGLACFSVLRSTSALLASSPFKGSTGSSAATSRRNFLTTSGSIITAAASLSLVYKSAATTTTTTSCESFHSSSSSSSSSTTRLQMTGELMTGYLNAADAAALDAELMSSPGFSLEQLMELAGLAVAEAVYQVIEPTTTNDASASTSTETGEKKKILLICGPGNNGGDGLVAARHLVFFGYDCVIVYPKRSNNTHFVNLVKQCEDVDIPILDEMPKSLEELKSYSAIVDAIFGFSFKGAPREPFASALKQMQEAQTSLNIPVLSVDVPSGWNVDEGDVAGTGFVPQVLISLTTPKESAREFRGRHFVGGRFLPPKLAEKYNVKMPPYPGVSQVMEVTSLDTTSNSAKGESSSSSPVGWEAEYAAYLESKYAAEQAEEKEKQQQQQSQTGTDEQFLANKVSDGEDEDEESWEVQYAKYCAEKEARLAEEDARHIAALKGQT